jgi:hypothetical protein
VFAKRKITMGETVEARRAPIMGDKAWELLKEAEEIIVGSGKKMVILHPATDSREIILAHCLGRTGSLRAPTLKTGTRLLVGFNDEMYRAYIK